MDKKLVYSLDDVLQLDKEALINYNTLGKATGEPKCYKNTSSSLRSNHSLVQ